MDEGIKATKARPLTLLVVLSLGFVMAVLDTTGVVLAVPEIKKFLVVSISESVWIINAYTLTLGTFLLLAGNLATKFGARKTLMTGMLLFVIASLSCSLAGNIYLLIGFRFIQGLGAALFMPASMAILYRSFSDTGELPKMLGIWTTIISVATGTGSFIGGTLIQYFGWRSVFLINVPLGLITVTYVLLTVQRDTPNSRAKIDVLSNFLLVLVVSSLVIFLVEGNQFGYGRWRILAFLAAAVLLGIGFMIRVTHSPAPIIPKILLRKPEFTATNLVGFLTNVSLYGIVLVLGLYYQMALHLSSLVAGLLILPGMTVLIIGNIFYTKYATQIGPQKLAICATIVTLIGAMAMLGVSSLAQPIPIWAIILNFAIMSIGIGVVVPASTTLLMQAAGNQYYSIAGATLNANKQIGGLFGTAIMGMIITHFGSNWAAVIQGTFVVNVILYLVAAFLLWKFVGQSTTEDTKHF